MEQQEATQGPTVSLVDGGISIDFSGHWNRNMTDYHFFSMSRKRNFATMAERSGTALATLLQDSDFAYGLLALRYGISLPEEDAQHISEESLPTAVADLFNESAVSMIGEIVDQAYDSENIDINTGHGGKNNEELQFTNEHARVILRWSYACVAAAPIITTFMDERDIQARDSMNVIIGVFGALLRRFEPEGGNTDILAKIRKLVESRVLQTRYSDKVMWNYLRNVATDPYIFIDRLLRKFIAEGIPKLEQGTNVIKFFHTFLKNQIKFQFTAKFPISFKPVRPDVMDPDGVGGDGAPGERADPPRRGCRGGGRADLRPGPARDVPRDRLGALRGGGGPLVQRDPPARGECLAARDGDEVLPAAHRSRRTHQDPHAVGLRPYAAGDAPLAGAE